ncbi:MAG: O-antigen ligase family protein [Bacteroidota bacterium]
MKSLPQKISLAGIFLFAFSIPISFVPAEFGMALAILGWAADGLMNKRWKFQGHAVLLPLAFYLAWNLLSSLISPRPLHSLWAWADNEWSVCIMLVMFWTVEDVQTLRRLVYTFLATSSIAMIYGIWQTFYGVELYRGIDLARMENLYRSVGFNGFYLTFAGFAMSVFFLAASFFIETKSKVRWLLGAAALAAFLAVVGTFARSIWLSFLVAIPASGFLRGRKMGLILTGSFIVVIAAVFLIMPDIRHRAFSIMDISANETRLNLWKTSIKISNDFPILGIGEDNFDYYFERYRVEGYYDATGHPHNDYFSALVQSGYPGLLAFIAIWVVAIRAGYRSWRSATDPTTRAVIAGAMMGILGFMVGSFFQNYYGTFANCLGWWFITGLLMSAVKLELAGVKS